MTSRPTRRKPASRVRGKAPPRSKWMKDFLAALGETSNVSASAERARISPAQVYKVRREDSEFARKWLVALCEGYDNLEMETLYRLRTGIVVDEQGRKHDIGAALRLLAAHRDSTARQRALQDNEDTETIIASINAKLDMMRERAIAAGDYAEDDDADG